MDLFFRDMLIETRKMNDTERSVELSFSSEFPVLRSGYYEVLDHSPRSIRTDRMKEGLPVCIGHDLSTPVGRTQQIYFGADKKGRAKVFFSHSQRGEEALRDIRDGVLRDVSVGYLINEIEPDGSYIDGIPVHRATSWVPYEISLLAVPADPTVGVGRGLSIQKNEETKMKDYFTGCSVIPLKGSYDTTRSKVDLGLSEYEKQRYSLMNLVRGLITKDFRDCGFELSVSRASEKLMGRSCAGAFVPFEILTRDMSKGSSAAGGYLVGTDHRADMFIDLLRPKSRVIQLGARVLSGLTGDIAIPKQIAGSNGY